MVHFKEIGKFKLEHGLKKVILYQIKRIHSRQIMINSLKKLKVLIVLVQLMKIMLRCTTWKS